jgi:putative DNA methylase
MSDYIVKSPKKLIETALPLDAINEAAAREKSIRHGHPSTLHLWWARRPLAAARAVIFAQMVNDPGWKIDMEGREPTAHEKSEITRKRNKLFDIIKDLVVWENTTNEAVLNAAREEIRKSWKETCELNKDCPEAATLFNPEKLPAFHDPFAGGGAIPLEAQRLGLESYASDLNPVPVMINKAMIEIPPLFAGNKPVHPKDDTDISSSGSVVYTGAKGLAEDVAYYGSWMREEAFKRIGALYPPVKITDRMIQERPDLACMKGESLTVIAYIWVRTVASPNPAYKNVQVPLASTFVLSKKKGHEAWIEPVISGNTYTFKVHTGKYPKEAEDGTKVGSRTGFKCLLSGTSIDFEYVQKEGKTGNIKHRLMALVCEGTTGRVYLSPDYFDTSILNKLTYSFKPEGGVPARLTGGTCVPYGLSTWGSLFTDRQLTALSTFCDILPAAIRKVEEDAVHHGMIADDIGIEQQGTGAKAYAQAVGVYLDFLIDKCLDHSSSICGWNLQMHNEKYLWKTSYSYDLGLCRIESLSSSTGSFNNMYIRMIVII